MTAGAERRGELDARFSGPGAVATPWEQVQRVIEDADAAWAVKYAGDWQFEVGGGAFHHDGGEALVFEVVIDKVLAFAKGEFAQTRFRF